METHYEILGVSSDAAPDEIRAAYRSLAKQYHPDINHDPDAGERFIAIQQAYETLMALPEGERRARIDELIAAADARRAERPAERPWTGPPHHHRGELPPPERMLMFGRDDFWAIIDAEDAAQAIEKGILAEYEGSHPLFVNADVNSAGVPTRVLADLYFPEVTTWRREVNGQRALVSIERARELIGFEPTPWPPDPTPEP